MHAWLVWEGISSVLQRVALQNHHGDVYQDRYQNQYKTKPQLVLHGKA
jgi:hypothetical protein